MRAAWTVTIAMLSPALAFAGPSHYECVIAAAAQLNQRGELSESAMTKPFLGVRFTVDRETGRIIGGPLDNANLKTRVLEKGSGEMAFQSFSESTQRSHTTHIQVQEFVEGSDKPFLGTTTLYYPGVYSGKCK